LLGTQYELLDKYKKHNKGDKLMSETLTKIIVNCETGVVAEVPLTSEEIAQREVDAARAETERQAMEAQAQAKADAKLAAQAKLAALGLTSEEIAALG
jgi:hypothetical protein